MDSKTFKKHIFIYLLWLIILVLFFISLRDVNEKMNSIPNIDDDSWYLGYRDCENNFNYSSEEQRLVNEYRMKRLIEDYRKERV